ncbi:MAG: hypothetical protein ACJAS6_000587 [Rickettsiales bacterium]|jgi:hypothetical protein
MKDHIGYDEIIEDSMRTIICKVLRKVEKNGLHGNHHFVVTFSTKVPETKISEALKEKFPSEMTIVVQHQFSGLKVEEDFFTIALSFAGVLERLTIPYRAISAFADPEVNFGLKFNIVDIEDYLEEVDGEDSDSQKTVNADLSGKIVSLADFRKNRDDKK